MSKEVSPLDFLKRGTEYVSRSEAQARLGQCESCPELIRSMKVCRRCGCFMLAKTTMAKATCPMGKW